MSAMRLHRSFPGHRGATGACEIVDLVPGIIFHQGISSTASAAFSVTFRETLGNYIGSRDWIDGARKMRYIRHF